MSYRITEEELLEELHKLESKHGKVTIELMRKEGKYSIPTYYSRFDSWNNALREANIDINREINIDEVQLLDELKRLQNEHGKVSMKLMEEEGKYSEIPYKQRFGSWNDALQEANIDVYETNISKRKLIYELKRLDRFHDNVHYDLIDEEGIYSTTAYERAFGTISTALEESGLSKYEHPSGEEHPLWKGGSVGWYGKNWSEQREKALNRDNYRCCLCGGQNKIVVHHIKPVRDFNVKEEYEAMNEISNLVTLCRYCHTKVEGKWQELNAKQFKNNLCNFRT
jgi:5-methylcytosine-specific restriction endonuclease McrA